MTPTPVLYFLWHPETHETFAGYGLPVGQGHLVGVIMVDRPTPVDPFWLATIEAAFGDYQLVAMTQGGEQGIVCQMHIVEESTPYLKALDHPLAGAIRDALLPLLASPPAVTLSLSWDQARRCWVSRIGRGSTDLFPLGQIVGTPGALRALEHAEQPPAEFLSRHVTGDWGELDEEDVRENDFSVQYGYRILSAYTTSAGDKLWVITEADRSVTTILLPQEY